MRYTAAEREGKGRRRGTQRSVEVAQGGGCMQGTTLGELMREGWNLLCGIYVFLVEIIYTYVIPFPVVVVH